MTGCYRRSKLSPHRTKPFKHEPSIRTNVFAANAPTLKVRLKFISYLCYSSSSLFAEILEHSSRAVTFGSGQVVNKPAVTLLACEPGEGRSTALVYIGRVKAGPGNNW